MRDNLNKENTQSLYIFEAIFVTIRLEDKLCTVLKGGGWWTQARTTFAAIADDETVSLKLLSIVRDDVSTSKETRESGKIKRY